MRGQGNQGGGGEGVLGYAEVPRPQVDAEIAQDDRSPKTGPRASPGRAAYSTAKRGLADRYRYSIVSQ